MKIKSLAVADTAFLHLKGPDGTPLYEDGKPVGIDLYSPGTSQHAEVEERRSSRAEKAYRDNDGKLALPPISERREQEVADLVTMTASFRNIEVEGLTGAALYTDVYSDAKVGWIKEQAQRFLLDWGKFKAASPTT